MRIELTKTHRDLIVDALNFRKFAYQDLLNDPRNEKSAAFYRAQIAGIESARDAVITYNGMSLRERLCAEHRANIESADVQNLANAMSGIYADRYDVAARKANAVQHEIAGSQDQERAWQAHGGADAYLDEIEAQRKFRICAMILNKEEPSDNDICVSDDDVEKIRSDADRFGVLHDPIQGRIA